MQFDLCKKDFIAYTIISIVGTILLVLGLSERISGEPARPTQALVGPVGAIPTRVAPCPGIANVRYDTLGDVIDQLGPPEKVFAWHFGGPENLYARYGYKYLYPTKGTSFIAYGPSRNYGNDELNNPHFVIPTVMPMNNLQATVTSECYPPTSLKAYIAQNPGYGEGNYGGGDQYVDWINP